MLSNEEVLQESSRFADSLVTGGACSIAVVGSWQNTSPLVENHVRIAVRAFLVRNLHIVTGGALGVDLYAARDAVMVDPTAQNLRVILPNSLQTYTSHLRRRAHEGLADPAQVETLVRLLEYVSEVRPQAIHFSGLDPVVTQEAYFGRNTRLVQASDAIAAFHVGESPGTADAIAKALAMGKPVRRFAYEL